MPETILIVDDDRMIAQLTSLWVTGAGCKAVMAYDGVSGLDAVATYHPDLILLDIRMPDIDGFEVYRRLKLNPEIADTPVIFLSAHAQESARNAAVTAGARMFLSKPYEAKDLLAAVKSALQPAA